MLPLTRGEGFHLKRVGELVFILHLLWGLFTCMRLVHFLPHLYHCSLLPRCSLQVGGVGERGVEKACPEAVILEREGRERSSWRRLASGEIDTPNLVKPDRREGWHLPIG